MIGALDKVEVMLYGNDGITTVNKSVEYSDKLGNILGMKAGCRLVKDLNGLVGRALGKLGRKLYSLRLAARKSG